MNLTSRHTVCACICTLVFMLFGQSATAQSSTLRIIVPASAGSGQDVMVRTAQNAMSKSLGRPVIVENIPGSGGLIGTQQLVKSAPDGNTIAFVSNNHAVNPAVYPKMPYDSQRDITPIAVVAETPFLLVVNPRKLPVSNAKEMAALLKSRPDQYNFGSSGNGTILHLAAEMYVDAAGVKVRHIPYKGAAQAMNDLLSGQIDFAVMAVPAVQAHLKAGTLRAVAATGATRVPSLPTVATLQEQGFNAVIGGWLAAVGPAKLPTADVKRLQDAILSAWGAPDVAKALADQENILIPMNSDTAGNFMAREQSRFAEIVRKIGVSLD